MAEMFNAVEQIDGERKPASHTPGPWIAGNARKVSNYGRWEAVITTATGNIGKAYGDEKATVAADARLIAAAPELLTTLKEMVDLFDGYQGMEWKRAKAAIAKAEGRDVLPGGGVLVVPIDDERCICGQGFGMNLSCPLHGVDAPKPHREGG